MGGGKGKGEGNGKRNERKLHAAVFHIRLYSAGETESKSKHLDWGAPNSREKEGY